MKPRQLSLYTWIAIWILSLGAIPAASAQGTTFTYQGRLNDSGTAANGSYDLRFTIFDAASSGSSVAGPVTNSNTTISNGLFSVTNDFGFSPFANGAPRWMEIAIRTNGATTFTTLTERQPITAAPYAIVASNITGVVQNNGLSGTYNSPVTFNNSGNSFSGNGSGLTFLNASQLTGGTVPVGALNNAWKTTGNAGTSPTVNFIGTTDNQAFEIRANGARAFRLQPSPPGGASVIGGSSSNSVASGVPGAVIAGGEANLVGPASFYAVVSGGYSNQIRGGGFYSAISGGTQNTIDTNAQNASILGGVQNRIEQNANSSTILGGWTNQLQQSVSQSSIVGGYQNVIETRASFSTIGGGWLNSIQSNVSYSMIGAGQFNKVGTNTSRSFIGGGLINLIQSDQSFIGAGGGNVIDTNSELSFIGAGNANTLQAGYSLIGSGNGNTIQIGGDFSVLAGGAGNQIQTNANSSVIGGGTGNIIQHDSGFSTIAGGNGNVIQDSADHATIAGGSINIISNSAIDGFIGGGQLNSIGSNATFSVISGGKGNTIGMFASYATIPGGGTNSAYGNFSFAAGRGAVANHDGAFVWSDSTTNGFSSTATNQFLINAGGGVGIGTNNPHGGLEVSHNWDGESGALTVSGDRATIRLNSGSVAQNQSWLIHVGSDGPGDLGFYHRSGPSSYQLGLAIATNNNVGIGLANPTNKLHVAGGVSATAFINTSDRNAKENFASVSCEEVLKKVAALPITTWNFKEMPGARHMGPMAQDFYAAFGLGGSDTTITTVDPDGVALAAIQGLNRKLEKELQQRVAETEQLKREVSELRTLVLKLQEEVH